MHILAEDATQNSGSFFHECKDTILHTVLLPGLTFLAQLWLAIGIFLQLVSVLFIARVTLTDSALTSAYVILCCTALSVSLFVTVTACRLPTAPFICVKDMCNEFQSEAQ